MKSDEKGEKEKKEARLASSSQGKRCAIGERQIRMRVRASLQEIHVDLNYGKEQRNPRGTLWG